MKNINLKEEKIEKKEIKAENSSPLIFKKFEDLGFSASFNNSKEKAFKENVKTNIKESIYSDFGIEVIKNDEKSSYEQKTRKIIKTKKINKKEAKEFNRKYREDLYKKIKEEQNKENKENKENKRKNNIFRRISNKFLSLLNFNKTTKGDILAKEKKNKEIEKIINSEIQKEQKTIDKLYQEKVRQQKVDELKEKTNVAINNIKENSLEFSKNVIETTKKESIKFYLKNIKDTVNRRINILNILVFLPMIILLGINIKLIKDIIIAQRAIDNANKYRKETIHIQEETERIQKEIKKLKEELKD